MKFRKVSSRFTNGTSLMGYFDGDFADIVKVFGLPCDDGDGYKVDAEWRLKFADGTIATIYNWKDGKNYNGEDGLELEAISDWHVGGFSKLALDRVKDALTVGLTPSEDEMESMYSEYLASLDAKAA